LQDVIFASAVSFFLGVALRTHAGVFAGRASAGASDREEGS
jgi:hypothetical protein